MPRSPRSARPAASADQPHPTTRCREDDTGCGGGRGQTGAMLSASTPDPPYYAVIFTTIHTGVDVDAYEATADRMEPLAGEQPRFRRVESGRGADGLGITVSYWDSEEAIAAWKAQVDHRQAQADGQDRWYQRYVTRVAKVERAYRFPPP